MEGDRQWAFTGPAFACQPVEGAVAPAAECQYRPAGWKRRRRRGRKDTGSKRLRRREDEGAALPSAQPVPPANPALLAPLRCSWPHPAVVNLLVQQCWPAAGAAALGHAPPLLGASVPPPSAGAAWNGMLPSLSQLHPPLGAQQQALLGPGPASSSAGGPPMVEQLPQSNVLVGYEDDWLEVPPAVLPLWQATPLAPLAGPKPLLHYLVCASHQLAQAKQFVRDVGSLYETCNLGGHQPASSNSVLTFQAQDPPAAPGPGSSECGSAGLLAALRQACGQLQQQLLLDPPAELVQQGASLQAGADPAVLVYLACPWEQPGEQVAALLEAAACLAPCTPLGSAAGAAGCLDLLLLPGGRISVPGGGQPAPGLAPAEPQQPDRPAVATPALDASRAPGGVPPPEEGREDGAAPGEGQQVGQQQQRYHGAARLLHQQQRGDYRQLPACQAQRPADSQPLRIVLQVLTPAALADISGAAARCTAFAVYSKAQHVPAQQLGPAEQAPPQLPFCCQPLVVLAAPPGEATAAPAAQAAQRPPPQQQDAQQLQPQQQDAQQLQPQQQDAQQPPLQRQGGELPSQPPRTLHCFYRLPPPGCSLVPLAVADTCGELLHAELLDWSVAGMSSLAGEAVSSDSLATAEPASRRPLAARACRSVLRRCLELLGALRASSSPPDLLSGVAIAGGGMADEERAAWRQLMEGDPRLQLEVPAGARLAVLELQALPPARYAGPDPPSGCRLLWQPAADDGEGGELRARIAWLPPADGERSLLPHEHDTVRMLDLALVARCPSDEQPDLPASAPDSLRGLARELHGLAWLHTAFQGACLHSASGDGQAAAPDAHLPIHAAAAVRLSSLLAASLAVHL